MNNSSMSSDQFRTLARDSFKFLEQKGIQSMPSLEETSPTMATVVYLGKHVGFIFSLDMRDNSLQELIELNKQMYPDAFKK